MFYKIGANEEYIKTKLKFIYRMIRFLFFLKRSQIIHKNFHFDSIEEKNIIFTSKKQNILIVIKSRKNIKEMKEKL